jgi:ribonuclease E
VQCHRDVASYLLNEKRDRILALEQSFEISIFVVPSENIKAAEALIERGGERLPTMRKAVAMPFKMETALADESEQAAEELQEEAVAEEEREEARVGSESEAEQRRGRRRRRRGRRGGRRGRGEPTESPEMRAVPEPAMQGERTALDETSFSDGGEVAAVGQWQPTTERESGAERPVIENGTAANSKGVELQRGQELIPSEPTADTAHREEQSDQEERRWTPPEPTVDRSKVRPKAGWWQRRSQE